MKGEGNQVKVIIKKKDVLEQLLQAENIVYENILREGKKGGGKLSLGWSLLKRYSRIGKKLIQFKPDLMLGTSAEIAHWGKLLHIPSYIFQEDDWDVIPFFAKTVYPFATKIVAPFGCRTGKWENKTIRHNSYHELAYLHPDHFTPSREIVKAFHDSDRPYFILRFVELSAFHDKKIKGITNEKALKLIYALEKYGDVYITSERDLCKNLTKYQISINPLHIHHALFFAKIFIGDSQTMAAESMVLGTPSIRYNDFVGKISYLKELEEKYQLGYGFTNTQFKLLLEKVDQLLKLNDLETEWSKRRDYMLGEKINLSRFVINFVQDL